MHDHILGSQTPESSALLFLLLSLDLYPKLDEMWDEISFPGSVPSCLVLPHLLLSPQEVLVGEEQKRPQFSMNTAQH